MHANNKRKYIKVLCIAVCLFFGINTLASAEEPTLHQKAAQEEKKRNYSKSNYYYLKILSKQANDIEALYGAANGFQQLHRYERALVEVDKLLHINPNHEQGLLLRAYICIKDKQWENALKDINQVIHINPVNAKAYMYMDNVYSAMGDKEAAEKAKQRYQQLTTELN